MDRIDRPDAIAAVRRAFAVHPAVALVGPRQAGKTTLARMVGASDGTVHYFDLERPVDRRRLARPESTLAHLDGLVIIDEIQREPELFDVLRFLIDREDSRAQYMLLGSASPHLMRGASESLAGRVGIVDLGGFTIIDVGPEHWGRLWNRGGFPRSYLAASDEASANWRASFVRTFLERDIPQLGISIPADRLRRFWSMVAHFHGQVWNAAEFARALGTSEPTARSYLDILSGAYVVRVLAPWYENLKKRQVKAPKVYVRDSGLLHSILQIDTPAELQGHPKVGASFEGFVIEQLLGMIGRHSTNAYYWATHAGAELDLMLIAGGKRYGVEVKLSDAPAATRSMRTAFADLALEHLWVIFPGSERYGIDDEITALPVTELATVAAVVAAG